MTTVIASSQIVRSCHQAEILRVRVTYLNLRDLAELEPAENMTDITLCWYKGLSMKKVFPVLKRWRYLRRLKVHHESDEISVPPFEVLSDFIMGMKHLSHLEIVTNHNHSNSGQLKILRDKVNKLILPRRSDFKFDINHDIFTIFD
jgi:hypothetical protein